MYRESVNAQRRNESALIKRLEMDEWKEEFVRNKN